MNYTINEHILLIYNELYINEHVLSYVNNL